MTWRFPAARQSPRDARAVARDYAARHGADPETLNAVALCVSEAVSNVVVHAYRNQTAPGEVELEARAPAGSLCLCVRDWGEGVTPRVDGPGIGLGLALISQTAASTEIRTPDDGGTEVVMRFDLGSACASLV